MNTLSTCLFLGNFYNKSTIVNVLTPALNYNASEDY